MRQGPGRERHDRRRPAQRPRPGLPPGERPGPAPLPARADGRRPAPRLDRDRSARARAATPFDLLGRLVPGRLDHRRSEDPRDGDPRRASSRSGAGRTPARSAGSGRTARCRPAILIRTFVADGQRLTLHVGGGITWRSDPAAEWDETVAKARGPLAAIGGREVGRDGRRAARPAGPAARLGRRPARWPPTRRTSRPSIAASSSATACSRRCAPAAAGRPSCPSTWPGCIGPPLASAIPLAGRRRRASRPTASTTLLAAEGLAGPDGDATVRITVSRGPSADARPAPAGRASARPRSSSRRGRSRRRRPAISSAASTSSRARVRRDPENPLAMLKTTSRADYVYARLEARRAGADDALFLTIDGYLSEATTANIFLVRRGRPTACSSSPRRRSTARSCPGTTRVVAARAGRARVGLRPVEGRLTHADLAARRRGVPVVERGRDPARDPVRRRARSATAGRDRGRCAPAPTARR